MQYNKANKGSLLADLFILTLILAVPVQAQDSAQSDESTQQAQDEQRVEFRERNFEIGGNREEQRAVMESRRAARDEYLAEHPEEAAKMAERRAAMANRRAERGENKDGPGPGRGERGERRPPPPREQ